MVRVKVDVYSKSQAYDESFVTSLKIMVALKENMIAVKKRLE